MSNVKQVIVIRTKFRDDIRGEFGISKGKAISQGCHSSLEFLRQRILDSDKSHNYTKNNDIFNLTYKFDLSISPIEYEWMTNEKFTKICIRVDSEEELDNIYNKAKEAGLTAHMIIDSGLTEFNGVPTKTAVAIGPNLSEDIDKITGHLKLL